MATHSSMPLAVVGTQDGHLLFVDYSDLIHPRCIEFVRLHKSQVKLLRFNSSDTMLFSVGDDNKLFVIDTRLLEHQVEKVILKNDQRLNTNGKQESKFRRGFFVLGYLEFDNEAVCLDTFDSVGDQDLVNTRVVLGIHDPAAWEIIRKTVQDTYEMTSTSAPASDNKSNKNSTDVASTSHHSILVQNVQTQSQVGRVAHLDNVDQLNYDLGSSASHVKLACKIITFDIHFGLFGEAQKLYNTVRMDFKDEPLSKCVYYTHYLFSDCSLSARNYLLAFSDRFLIKFIVPEFDANKKQTNKFSYLELAEIVGAHDFGYGKLYRS